MFPKKKENVCQEVIQDLKSATQFDVTIVRFISLKKIKSLGKNQSSNPPDSQTAVCYVPYYHRPVPLENCEVV